MTRGGNLAGTTTWGYLLAVLAALALSACNSSSGGSGGSGDSADNGDTADPVDPGDPGNGVAEFTIGGSVSGLDGALVLQNNGGDDLSIAADGDFTFATALEDGDRYAVTVANQPTGQTCTVSNGNGKVEAADVTNVAVSCADDTTIAAPEGLLVAAGDQSVTLSWASVSETETYTVYWSQAPDIHPDTAASYDDHASGIVPTEYTVTELTNGTTYYFVVTAVSGTDESEPSGEVSATPTQPGWAGPLNDTGITLCGDYHFGFGVISPDNDLNCAVVGATATTEGTDDDGHPVPPAQDAFFGRDADDALAKTGGGDAGFDFTRIANDGRDLQESATVGDEPEEWACTLDNHTGLMWEIKVDDPDHLRHMAHRYTWYSTGERSDGTAGEMNGSTGTVSGRGTSNGGHCHDQFDATDNPDGNRCDTAGYVAAVNAAGLCGYNDWRMPTLRELLSIVHNGRVAPAVDADFFPNTSSNREHWTASPNGDTTGNAWFVDFDDGNADASKSKSNQLRARLVRTAQ